MFASDGQISWETGRSSLPGLCTLWVCAIKQLPCVQMKLLHCKDALTRFIFVPFALQGLVDVQNSLCDARQVKHMVMLCKQA